MGQDWKATPGLKPTQPNEQTGHQPKTTGDTEALMSSSHSQGRLGANPTWRAAVTSHDKEVDVATTFRKPRRVLDPTQKVVKEAVWAPGTLLRWIEIEQKHHSIHGKDILFVIDHLIKWRFLRILNGRERERQNKSRERSGCRNFRTDWETQKGPRPHPKGGDSSVSARHFIKMNRVWTETPFHTWKRHLFDKNYKLYWDRSHETSVSHTKFSHSLLVYCVFRLWSSLHWQHRISTAIFIQRKLRGR